MVIAYLKTSLKQWRNSMILWIARDENGALHIFREKPALRYKRWWGRDVIYEWEIDTLQYPEVTFENSPMDVELVIKER